MDLPGCFKPRTYALPPDRNALERVLPTVSQRPKEAGFSGTSASKDFWLEMAAGGQLPTSQSKKSWEEERSGLQARAGSYPRTLL